MYGLECEFFLFKDGEPQMVPTNIFPYDECGYLVEARGKPAGTILEAVFLLKAEIYRLDQIAARNNYTLKTIPLLKIPPKLMNKVRRNFSKGVVSYENLYGYENHANGSFATAGIHISFTKQETIHTGENSQRVVNVLFDFPKVFRILDKQFAIEIKNAKRRPGFYEIKSDGRVEYRSLPNNVYLEKIIGVFETFEVKRIV